MRVLLSVCVATFLCGCATRSERAQPMTGHFPNFSEMQDQHIRSIVDRCVDAITTNVNDREARAEQMNVVVDYYIKTPNGISMRVSKERFTRQAVYQCSLLGAAEDPILAPLFIEKKFTETPP